MEKILVVYLIKYSILFVFMIIAYLFLRKFLAFIKFQNSKDRKSMMFLLNLTGLVMFLLMILWIFWFKPFNDLLSVLFILALIGLSYLLYKYYFLFLAKRLAATVNYKLKKQDYFTFNGQKYKFLGFYKNSIVYEDQYGQEQSVDLDKFLEKN